MQEDAKKDTYNYLVVDYRGAEHTISLPLETLESPIETARAAQVAELYGMLSMEALLAAQIAGDEQAVRTDAMLQSLTAQAEALQASTRAATAATIAGGLATLVAVVSSVLAFKAHGKAQETQETLERLIWLQAKDSQDRVTRNARAEALLASAEASMATKQ